MLTETEVMGKALAVALLKDSTTFGVDSAKLAMAVVSKLAKDNQATDEACDGARARLGNHSAIRQWAVKHGLIAEKAVSKDALCNAVETAMKEIQEQADESLEIEKEQKSKKG